MDRKLTTLAHIPRRIRMAPRQDSRNYLPAPTPRVYSPQQHQHTLDQSFLSSRQSTPITPTLLLNHPKRLRATPFEQHLPLTSSTSAPTQLFPPHASVTLLETSPTKRARQTTPYTANLLWWAKDIVQTTPPDPNSLFYREELIAYETHLRSSSPKTTAHAPQKLLPHHTDVASESSGVG